MAELDQQLNERFAPPNDTLKPEVLTELQSIIRLHQISLEELSYKWEAYCMKMGAEETALDLKTARDFKKDLQDTLERESRSKAAKSGEKRTVAATPRAGMGSGDVFGMLDSLVPNTPRSGALGGTVKRKSNFETPLAKASKSYPASSPSNFRTPDAIFAERTNAGEVVEHVNAQIPLPEPAAAPPTESRIKLKANTEVAKFSYKTMAMKLSEASEILDDRIEEFMSLVQAHHNLEDSVFGNPSRESQSEIVAVGRIASDSSDGKLNTASLVLETSRKGGAGLRVPLKVERLQSYDFFLGKIVALRGTNASGDFFSVNEVLDLPHLNLAASIPETIDTFNVRLRSDVDEETEARPLTVLVASGPYTTDDTLDFSPFQTLLSTAEQLQADGLILCGPFLDAEHSMIQDGDFDLPSDFHVEPDQATLNDLFRYHISRPLQRLTQSLPSISVILCPSIRDTALKHAAWPQDRLPKRELQLPKQVSVVTNPMTLSLNEMVVGMSSADVLHQLRASSVTGGKARQEDMLARLCRQLLEQRHFFPVFPPTDREALASAGSLVEGEEMQFNTLGASLDLSYLKLGEMYSIRPDVLIVPSVLKSFAKVVEGVIAINPGTLSKKRGPGTYARMTIKSLQMTDEEREKGDFITHRLYERCRIDIVRI